VKTRLTELLACPECSGPLRLDIQQSDKEEILAGLLGCPKCRCDFPIRDGIPRFVPSDAYMSSSSFEWKLRRRTPFDTESRKFSESTFVASTGTRPEELAGKLVLDVGCGSGRFMDVVARSGAETVGLDPSLAVDAARENLRSLPHCHFIQANALFPPFRPGTFDFAYSIGGLTNASDSREGFRRMAATVKPRGAAAIWVIPLRRLAEALEYFPDQVNELLAHDSEYQIPAKRQKLVSRLAPGLDWARKTSSRFERFFTTRLPRRWLYALCHVASPLYYLYRIPIFYPMRLLAKIAMHPDPERRVLDTFEWYSLRYQWKHTYPQVQAWFEKAGFENITLLPRPVAMRGNKPAY
jgi:uncharacterized protein YbaR (Trm112 family)